MCNIENTFADTMKSINKIDYSSIRGENGRKGNRSASVDAFNKLWIAMLLVFLLFYGIDNGNFQRLMPYAFPISLSASRNFGHLSARHII